MTICRNCNKTAQFNTADEKKGKYCKNHKLEGMINVTIKRCYQKECMKNNDKFNILFKKINM